MENVNWDQILNDLKAHKGTLKEFCEKNNISQQTLYSKRKKANMINNVVFHEVKVSKIKEEVLAIKPEIKIKYGNLDISLSIDNIKLIAEFIKELAKEC